VSWVLNNIPLLVFAFVLFSVVRAIVRASRLSDQHKADTNETEEQKHLREIQDRIRKKIAERRAGATPGGPPPLVTTVERAPAPPVMPSSRVPPLDPFGGPGRRLLVELERKLRPAPVQSDVTAQTAVVLERQQKLAEQMRTLEEARMLEQRRADRVTATQKADGESATGARTAARDDLLADLRGAPSLRRAFVLREVLGAPVGLR
jgi:hypothetical protein